jgi:hypothetical protein
VPVPRGVGWSPGLVLLAVLVDPLSPPVLLTAEQDHQRIMDLLHIVSLRPGADGRNRSSANGQISSGRFLFRRAVTGGGPSLRPARGLSTGVNARGTPGSTTPGGEVPRRVGVPIVLHAAHRARPSSDRQRQRLEDRSALRACPARWEEARREDHPRPVPSCFVLQHPPEGRPARIRDVPRQAPVAYHPPHVQLLQHHHRLGLRSLVLSLCRKSLRTFRTRRCRRARQSAERARFFDPFRFRLCAFERRRSRCKYRASG